MRYDNTTPTADVRRKAGRRISGRTILCTVALAALAGVYLHQSRPANDSSLLTSRRGVQTAGFLGLDDDQVNSILRGVKAIQKTQQELTPEQEYYLGRSVAATVLQSYKPLDRPQANEYLNLLGSSLAIFSDCPETFGGYHFLLLDSDEINAFAAPGGLIMVTRGMIRCCQNEDELAAVLAHEISHVALKHGISAIKQSRLNEALTIIAAESAKQSGDEKLATLAKDFQDSVSDITTTLLNKGYSRKQEKQADEAAVKLLGRAGYPEMAMITMLNRMDVLLGKSGGLGFAKTHPSARSRAKDVKKVIKDTGATPDAARQSRFTAAMQPIIDGK